MWQEREEEGFAREEEKEEGTPEKDPRWGVECAKEKDQGEKQNRGNRRREREDHEREAKKAKKNEIP